VKIPAGALGDLAGIFMCSVVKADALMGALVEAGLGRTKVVPRELTLDYPGRQPLIIRLDLVLNRRLGSRLTGPTR
jgi:hypothetical protein